MSRKSKVVGLSLPPEIHNKVEKHLQKTHKSRSEFYREMISLYFKQDSPVEVSESDLATLLKNYWIKKSSVRDKIIPIVLAIIVNEDKNILIGARCTKDKWVENLTWVFPGGELKSLDFESEVMETVKKETGLTIEVKDLVTARIHPDAGFKEVQIIALYFYCETKGKGPPIPGGSLNKLKWVKPLDVFKYFTTSTSDEVTKFLTMIQKSN